MKKILTNVYLFNDSKTIQVYTALWDTGSTESLISSKVVKELNLNKMGEVEISSINETSKVNRWKCNLLLNGHSKSISFAPAEYSSRKECDIIIGMDIISCGKFLIENDKFSFIIKSLL